MPVINLKQLKINEPTRNFDSSVDANTNIPGENDQGLFGGFKFFAGIKAFFKGISALGTLASGSRLPVTDSNGNVTYTTMNDINSYVVNNALTDYQPKAILKENANDCVPFFTFTNPTLNCYSQTYVVNRPSNPSVKNNTPDSYRNWVITSTVSYTQATAYTCEQIAMSNVGEVRVRTALHSSGDTEWTWGNWEKVTTEADLKNKTRSQSFAHSNGQYAKLTVTVNEPYTTTIVALMGRGGGLAMVGVCASDSSNANMTLYLKNTGYYANVNFYYKQINSNTIEFYWLQGAYSNRSNYTILTNPENSTVSYTVENTLPSGTTQL